MSGFFGHTPPRQDALPERLFHYTTQRGLLGILRDQEIWMTHTQYLNDVTEFRHAINLVTDEINRRLATAQQAERVVLEEMLGNVSLRAADVNVCVACFSEDGDSLSQWRAYGEPAAGYAIGFDGAFISRLANVSGFGLVKCVYEEDETLAFVRNFVSNNVSEVLAKRIDDPSHDDYYFWRTGGNFRACLNRVAPVFKNHAFKDEREWRLISRPLMCSTEGFDYRPGKSMVVPYFRLSITNQPDEVDRKRFHSVVVGPTPNPEQAEIAVGSVLASRRLASDFTPGGPVQVVRSTVPHRTW
jgi:hypothetical protein